MVGFVRSCSEKMFLIKEKDENEGIMTTVDFFGELEQLDLEREALAGNNNQGEKIILMDDTEDTTIKADVFRELE